MNIRKNIFSVELTNTARKQLKSLPVNFQKKIASALLGLTIDPFPFGYKKLSGADDISLYRIRVGIYRIIYEIHQKQVVIKVIKITHRKDVY